MSDKQVDQAAVQAGQGMKKVGGYLTLIITVPILGLVMFGAPGLTVGIIVAVLAIVKGLADFFGEVDRAAKETKALEAENKK
jgi:hypothetical protein